MSRTTPRDPSTRTGTIGEFTGRELALLAEKAPAAYHELMAGQRHLRHLAWADLIAQTVGHLSGLVSLSILAVVSWHAFDLGAATQGASIICTGAVSIVTVFVTGRLIGRRAQTRSDQVKDSRDSKMSRDPGVH